MVRFELVWLISHGTTTFISGGAVGFDLIAGREILELRNYNPNVKLIIAVPCIGQEKWYSEEDKDEYYYQLRNADSVVILSDHYFSGCMQARNRYMIQNSHMCLCWLERNTGGTAYTVKMARKAGFRIVNLAESDDDEDEFDEEEFVFRRADILFDDYLFF